MCSCPSDLILGDVVRLTGSLSVSRVDITGADMGPIAVITEKITSTSCVAQAAGVVESTYYGLTPGSNYFVNSAGRPAIGRPHGLEAGPVWVVLVGVAASATKMLLQPTVFARVRT